MPPGADICMPALQHLKLSSEKFDCLPLPPPQLFDCLTGLTSMELTSSTRGMVDEWHAFDGLGKARLKGCMCCPLMWHLPRFVWLIRHALSRDPSLSFAFQSL